MSAVEVLRVAHAALTADAPLIAALGGPHVYEHVPARASPPYLVLSDIIARDWSTATEEGAEVELTVRTFSDASNLTQLKALQERVTTTLTFGAVAVPGHALVDLRPLETAIERRPDDGLVVGTQRFLFIIEPE